MARHLKRAALAATAALAVGGVTTDVRGAGFALIEQGASGVGNAYAGAAAVAEDASTVFFNPAGMARLDRAQVVLAGHVLNVDTKFQNNGSTVPGGFPTGGNGGQAGDVVLVPNLYAVIPLNDRMRFGVSLTSPFGLATEYGDGWVGRFQALKSEVKTLSLNPSLSYKVNDQVAVGVGFSVTTLDATIRRNQLLQLPGPVLNQGTAQFGGSDTAFSFNVGVLFSPAEDTRLGLAYRSKTELGLEGSMSVNTSTGVPIAAATGPITADLTLPASLSASLYQGLTDRWALLADITFTTWSDIQSLVVRPGGANVGSSTQLDLHFRDTYRFSVGANYQLNDAWKLRFGVAWDQSPVTSSQERTANLPDNNRTWLAVGFRWQATKTGVVDFGYAHLFVRDTPIDHTAFPNQAQSGRIVGEYKNSIDIFSAQYTHMF